MRIGELSARTGVSIRMLRYYESQGLLCPERHANGYRSYAEEDVRLVRRIRALLAAGLSTAVIARMLPSVCEVADGVLRPCTPELADELRREQARIERRIADLKESSRVLSLAIAAAPTRP
ncbi:MerR family transcriptional regulator [Streptomyces sp. MST-110588]|uniref:MerR family transcriptional regulator n=1 Tax=Streptomyces sp. MST-110588 TaxID=2833628 RepID=UPI001F5C3608|nr:MerR family transcriptional regulator [Streptomyces sp. MST-110588]UNO41412.1 MerR family transcriptional regulator [Streptomyces sp. MST-110588]